MTTPTTSRVSYAMLAAAHEAYEEAAKQTAWDFALRAALEAALASLGDVVAVSELRALCDEWESESKDMEAPQPYREACRCFAGDLSAILNRGGK